ncbi:transglycosylase SLT domain-containing protein [Massilia sp. HP4]|uniref:transglycosylase SLT domain-containing protein n=1 Tax=Massilia sp. HP4 TaxID=2562316 RepID=UPI0010C071FB|nr:transglycosylase SLT domain-containing protein [Massilia sp. HP4]
MASQPITWSSVSKTASGLVKTARTTLTVFGLTAVAMLALLYTNDSFAKRVSEMLHPQPTVIVAAETVAPVVAPTPKAVAEAVAVETTHLRDSHARLGNSKQQQYVTNWLSKRYRVAGDAANMLVSTAYLTAHELKLDPLLILAVMAIESGLNPFAESPMGAKGLMQVMAKVHHDKFEDVGGPQAALNPVANIRVGALILKDYVKRTGSVEGGLKTYVGAANLETDSGYGNKVLNEYRLLKKVSSGQNVPVRTPRATPAPAIIVAAKQTETDAAKPEATPMQETKTVSNGGAQVPNVEPLAGL